MIERSVQLDANNSHGSKRAVRPTDLPTENRQRRMRHGENTSIFLLIYFNNFFFFVNSTIVSNTDGRAKESLTSSISWQS